MNTWTGNQGNADHQRVWVHRAVGIIVALLFSTLGVFVVASAADQLNISITNTLSPSNATIHVGTTVTWTNNDTEPHELRSDSGPVDFRTDELEAGQSASITFTTPGNYTYVDHHNQDSTAYRGTILVIDGVAPATPPAIGGAPAITPAPPSTASIRLAGGQFSPTTVTVGVGATVTWSNDDGSKHTVTADNASFDSGTLNAGATFVHTFAQAGTYTYGCDFHGGMRGTVIVIAAVGSPASVPTPPAAPTPAPVAPAAPSVTPAPGSAATNESVSIAGSLFSPSSITVNVGSSVTWANIDAVTHTVTADDQSFNSGLMKKATSWSRSFATAGTFAYFCEIHPEMVGTVIAKAPDGSVPPSAAPASNAATIIADTTATAGGTSSAGSAGAASGSIAINDSGFVPSSFRVAVGGTLTFANNGKATHTVTAANGSFDSDLIKPGGAWVHTFVTAGSFTYTCILHPDMRGTVDVGGSGLASATGATESASVIPPQTSAQTTADGGPAATTIQAVSIDVADNQFNPNPATVAVGATATWTLTGAAAHTVTADGKSFNSGLLKPGESYQYTFTTLGSFAYTCLVHQGMTGTIDVVPPDQAAAQQAASPPTNGDGFQTQQAAGAPTAVAAAGPAKSTGLWRDTLLGVAAALLACCALVFSLKSFLKILGSNDPGTEIPTTPINA